MARARPDAAALLAPRWSGRRGRLEVWYATLTDPHTGAGAWLHHEVVTDPADGEAHGLGWVAVFPPEGTPQVARFGPAPTTSSDAALFAVDGVTVADQSLVGHCDGAEWELHWQDDSRPLFTFPAWAWRRDALPAVQIVPAPTARFDGSISVNGEQLAVDGGVGAVAHIAGHGNAERWGWLHADLGHGDVLEIVAAVSRRPPLSRLRPLPLVQLRLAGATWPRDPLAAALFFRARLALPTWEVRGTVGRRRLRVDVTIPDGAAVSLDYRDPDGAPATCTNSERSDADVVVERWDGRWRVERRWELRGRAHAEIGRRP